MYIYIYVYHILNHVLILAKYGRIPEGCLQHLCGLLDVELCLLLHSRHLPGSKKTYYSSIVYNLLELLVRSELRLVICIPIQLGPSARSCLANWPLPHLLPCFASAGSVRRSAQSLMKACPVSTKIKRVSRSTFRNR